MPTIANLKTLFTADTRGFEQGTSRVRRGIGRLGGALAGLAGGIGFGAIVKGSLDAADAIQKMGIETGLSTQFLSAMNQGTQLSGASLDNLKAAAISLQRRTQLAIGANNEYAKSFEALGISAEAFAGLNPDEQIRVFAEAYSRLGTQQERNIVLTTLMNKSASKLAPLFQDGAAGLAALEQAARNTNQVLSQDQVDAAAAANDAMLLLRDSIGGLTRNLALELAPGIANIATILSDVLPRAIANVQAPFIALGRTIGGIAAIAGQIASGEFAAARATFGEIRGDVAAAFASARPGARARPEDSDAERKQVELLAEQNRKTERLLQQVRQGVPAVVQ